MLYLPRGIMNYLSEMAIRRAMNFGDFLITICCEYAWDHGYKCNHPESFKEFNKRHSEDIRKVMFRCKICGKLFIRDPKKEVDEEFGYRGGKPVET